jgi:hypothetical protein
MKRIVVVLTAFVLVFALSSCNVNSYVATGMVRGSWGGEATLKFLSFKGHHYFNLRAEADDTHIDYEAKLDDGEVNVYYCVGDSENLLFTIKGGEKLDSSLEYGGGNLKIKVVASEKCRGGSFEFELD